jgi:CRP/FNR family transcriptional regulator, cyclic AMP receptor protein
VVLEQGDRGNTAAGAVAGRAVPPPSTEGLPPLGRFLSALDGPTRHVLRELGVTQAYQPGEFVTLEGNRSSHVVIVLTGRVVVRKCASNGREVVLALRRPGDLIGDIAAVTGSERSATVEALTAVTAFRVAGPAFVEFVHQRPPVVLALLDLLATKLRESDQWRLERDAYDARTRVVRHVCWMAEQFGTPEGDWVRLSNSLTQAELASWVGTSRETASKAIADLRTRNLVRNQGAGEILVRLDLLRAHADQLED